MAAIYLTKSRSRLTVDASYFQVYDRNQLTLKIPAKLTSHIVLFGNCQLDPQAAALAKSRDIPVLFLDNCGRFLSRLEPNTGTAKYLATQLQRSQDLEFTQTMAETILRAKLHNSRTVLKQLARNSASYTTEIALEAMQFLMDDLPLSKSVSELRDRGAMATAFYYQALGELLTHTLDFPQQCSFHAPINSIDALLRAGNALLYQTVYGFVTASGLSPDCGILHLDSEGEEPLVRDLAAQFQPLLVDGLAGELATSKILTAADFAFANGHGGAFIYPNALQKFLKYWEEKLRSEVLHLRGGKVSYRQCLELQVLEYIAFLLGDRDSYHSFLVKFKADASIPLQPQELQSVVLVEI